MGKSCCAIDCKNRFAKQSELSFYRLPKAKEKRSRWISAIRRNNWNPGKETWICASHFVSGKKSDDPLHPDYVPSLFSFTSTADKTRAVNNLERYLRSQIVYDKRFNDRNAELAAAALLNLHQRPVAKQEAPEDQVKVKTEPGVQVTEVQTEETHADIASLYQQIKSLNMECQSLRNKVHELESELKRHVFDASEFDDGKIKFFTGLPGLQTFMLLLSCVSPVFPTTGKQSLRPTQELLLTLMKLHLNLSQEFLGYLFGVHYSTVARVFQRWTRVMASRLHPLIVWPEREDLRRSLPVCFRTFFKNCVSIVDCVEVSVERRAQTGSHDKQHSTKKFLVSVTPQGSACFVSKAFDGHVTDEHLVEHSGFLDKLLPGDVVLARRGFASEDGVGLFCAELAAPPFAGGKKQLLRKEIESAREVSRVRAHVERVIGTLRQKYTILGSRVPVSLFRVEQGGDVEDDLVDEIVLTCCALCNMCKSTVPSD